MIDIRKLKELVRLMVANDLTELDLRDSEEQVTLRRDSLTPLPQPAAPQVASSVVAAPPAAPAVAADRPAEEAPADDGLARIESPMVGTFYAGPNPDSAAFVEVGSPVGPETVVCLVEAMKIFNEIKAGCSGTVQKVLVKNAEPVEFGQTLFLVKPD